MFTLRDTFLKRMAGSFLPVFLAMGFYAGAAINAQAQLIPANDNLANAEGIVGGSGSVDALNVNATIESGEPAPDKGGASIWFIWTAPFTTTIDFTTFGSSDTLDQSGGTLDTVLVMYQLTNGPTLAYTNLTPVAANDNDPSGGLTSRVDVPVIGGQTYLIQVLGSSNNPTGGQPGSSGPLEPCAEGNVELSWSPSLVAGGFGFSTSTYFVGEFDDYWLLNYSPNSVAQSLANATGKPNVRITVTRQGGFTGACQVTLTMTNAVYTNLFQTNLSGTNLFMTNYSTNNPVNNSTCIGFTNVFQTVYACQNIFTNFVGTLTSGGGFEGFPVWNVYEVVQTNYNTNGAGPMGNVTGPLVTNLLPIPVGLTNFFTNWPYANSTTVVEDTNATPVTIVVTQLFNLGTLTNGMIVPEFSTNRTVPAASNGMDYVSITTNLLFTDFQMSQDVYLNVNPLGEALGGPDSGAYFGLNPLVMLSLSNPTNVPGEDPNIVPPTITQSSAYVDILNFYSNPNNFVGSAAPLNTNTALGNYATVNFERASFRCNRVPDGSGGANGSNAYIYLVLAGSYPATASYTFHYTVDCPYVNPPGGTYIPISSFDWNTFPTEAGSDYAVPGYYTNEGVRFPDFGNPVNNPPDPSTENVGKNTTFPADLPYVGQITIGPFTPGEPYGEIAIPILTNGAVEFDQDMIVQLYESPSDYAANIAVTFPGGQPAPAFIGNVSEVNLTINFTGQPGGAYDTSFNIDGTPQSSPAGDTEPGATPGTVQAIALQPNGQAIIGGSFEFYDEQTVYGIARLLTNGFVDTSFNNVKNPGVGAGGNSVSAIAIDSSGRIIIAGSFSSYDGLPNTVNNIARLNNSGGLDTTFNSGTGFDGPVSSLAIDANGNILVGGDFQHYNSTIVNNIVRLLPNGSLDPAFLPNTGNGLNYGTDLPVNAVALDSNGNIVLGGGFGSVNGSSLSFVARLLPSGAVDSSFAPAVGPDDVVNSVAIEPNNEILIGGSFDSFNSISSPGIALLGYNGSLDTSFVPGTGADGDVNTVVLQPNGEILVGGQFRNFDSVRRLGVARLLPNGWVDTSFMDTSYNQFAGLINKATTDPINAAYALAEQGDGNILVGGSFTNIGGGSARTSVHTQFNITRLIGAATPGPMTGGGVVGNNCPGNVTFTQNPYTVLDTAGKLFVTLDRTNGSLGPAQVTLGTNLTAGGATAADLGLISGTTTALFGDVHNLWTILPYGDYGWRDSDGFYGYNNAIMPITDFGASGLSINIFNDPAAGENLLANLSLLNATSQGMLSLGGVPIPTFPAVGLPEVQLDILDNNINPGVVGFSASNYTALDTVSTVTLTVDRVNGNYGALNLQYYTVNGSAISTNNYVGVTAGKGTPIKFTGGSGGNTSVSFTIPITLQTIVQPTTKFTVYLTNTSVGGTINTNEPPYVYPSATVTIEDGNFAPGHLNFTNTAYTALKGGLATIGVARTGGSQGQLTVQCAASNGTGGAGGVNGVNYIGVTNTLSWGSGDETVKTMTVQTLQDNTVEGTKTVNLSLSNPTNTVGANNGQILIAPTTAVLNIQDIDSYGGLTFVANNFNIFQNSGQALITVIRTNGTTGSLTVGYTNFSDINAPNLGPSYAPAVAGTNFGATNGVLSFGPGVTSQSFVVPVYYTPNETNVADRLVTLELFNPSTGVTGTFPRTATLTILDPQLVTHSPGAVDPAAESAVGTGFNGNVDSVALQPDGNVLVGGNFTFVDNYPFNNVTELLSDGHYNSDFLGTASGGNVLQILNQNPVTSATDGPVLIAGNFTNVDGVNRGLVARLNVDGSLDETFNPNAGASDSVLAVAETSLLTAVSNQFSLAYYIGGDFADYNGVPVGGIARLNASTNSPGAEGNLDPTFNVLQGVTSGSGGVDAVAVQANGQIVLGGDFTAFNSLPYNHMVRLNEDGSVDPSFLPNTNYGPMGAVRAIAIQPDGQILIGGLFTNVGGSNLNYLARLNGADGSVDPTFNPEGGGNNAVLALTLDSQNRILVGGEFTRFGGVSRDGITRLNTNGTVDPTINFGSGADGGFLDTMIVDATDEIDVGGGFSTFEGLPANNFTRLYGLSKEGNGTFQFTAGTYGVVVSESATNIIVTVERQGPEGTNALTPVTVQVSTADGTTLTNAQPGLAGVDYTPVTTNLNFPYGEVFETVTIPILPNSSIGSNKDVTLNLTPGTNGSINGIISGNASATLYLTNENSAVSFGEATTDQSANSPGGNAIIPVVRIGDINSTVGVNVSTGSGTAVPNVVYTPTTNFLVFNPGVTTQSFLVPLLNPPNYFSDESVPVFLSEPSNTIAIAPSTCLLTINGSNGPGVISFSQPGYSIVAPVSGQTNAVITINETENLSNTVSVILTTTNGTATSGLQYGSVSVTNFFTGQSNATVNIPIYAQAIAGPATTVLLTLSAVQGGASIAGPTQETLTILNGIESVTLTNLPYSVNESNNTFVVQVARGGPATNTAVSVNYYTYTPPGTTEAEGYAQPNVDYTPVSGTLTLNAGVPSTSFSIPILQANSPNPNPVTFEVGLDGAVPTNVQIGPTGLTTVSILGDVTGFALSSSNDFIGENGSNIVINVNRLNAGTGTATVQYATSDGTASNHVDYTSTSGTLTFANGQTSGSFSVPILNKNLVESSKTFNVALSNPLITVANSGYTKAFLVQPSNAVVTITNVLTGVSFGSLTYNVSECDATAAIPVILTGAASGNVSVTFSTTTGGSAVPGLDGNYIPVTNTVTFTNGQTIATNYVEVLNNHIIGPNHTVYLALSGATGAQLLNPSTAVLTIDECNGAYIVGSGTAFVSGNISPGSGVLFPNETVTLLLGLRDVAGSNTTSLVATLQPGNGIANVSGAQNYGVLITNGPTVSRQFTFEAVGTNGQNVSASLALTNGSQTYSNVDFGFTLGGINTTFSTNETLTIFGSNNPPSKASSTNPPNYGYPSIINVAGVVGTVTAVSAGISNFGHTYPSDVAAVLENPTGQSTLLMEDCGYTNAVSHLNLTFSQTASSSLPEFSAMTSGTYLPTSYGDQQPLPTSTNGASVPQTPFQINMNTFVGQPANGKWSLFVADDDTLDSGYISNGWFLTIGTGLPIASDADLEMTMTAPATTLQSNTLAYTIIVSNAGPANATNVVIADTLPPGLTPVSTNGLTNGVLTVSYATLAAGNEVTETIDVIPNAVGLITNSAEATSDQVDLNDNNAQTNVVLVETPSADLEVSLTDLPSFVTNGASVTYTVVVTNIGPAAATSVVATNTLPAGFVLSSTQTTSGTVSNLSGTSTWSIGNMVSGANSTLTVVAAAAVPAPGNYLDTVGVGSAVYDPNRANNFASVKTGVALAVLTLTPVNHSYTLSWPASSGYILEGTTNLPPVWVPITNASVTQQGTGATTSNIYSLPGTNGYHFFRLKTQVP